MSLFDELVTVIQPGQEGDESPLSCEDSSILLQVINIQTEKEEKKTKCKNSTDLTSIRCCYLKAPWYDNKLSNSAVALEPCFINSTKQKRSYPQLTDSTVSISRGSMDWGRAL